MDVNALPTASNSLPGIVQNVGGGQVDNTAEVLQNQTGGSTSGVSCFYVRAAKGVAILPAGENPVEAGTLLTQFRLDTNLHDQCKSLALQHFTYTIRNPAITVLCTAPWGTASGSVQIGFIPDPMNVPSTNTTVALDQLVTLTESQQVSAKGTLEIPIPMRALMDPVFGSNRRYCNALSTQTYPRLEAFGTFVIIVRGPAAIGDGTAYTVTFSGLFEFHDRMVFNTAPTSSQRFKVDFSEASWQLMQMQTGSYSLVATKYYTDGGGPIVIGPAIFDNPVTFSFKIQETGDDSYVETYPMACVNAMLYTGYDDEGNYTVNIMFLTAVSTQSQTSQPSLVLPFSIKGVYDCVMIYQPVVDPLVATMYGEHSFKTASKLPPSRAPQALRTAYQIAKQEGIPENIIAKFKHWYVPTLKSTKRAPKPTTTKATR